MNDASAAATIEASPGSRWHREPMFDRDCRPEEHPEVWRALLTNKQREAIIAAMKLMRQHPNHQYQLDNSGASLDQIKDARRVGHVAYKDLNQLLRGYCIFGLKQNKVSLAELSMSNRIYLQCRPANPMPVIGNALFWAALMFVVPSLPFTENRWTTIGLLVACWFAIHTILQRPRVN